MTDKEIDRLARELLAKAVKEIRTWEPAYFYSIDQLSEAISSLRLPEPEPKGKAVSPVNLCHLKLSRR